MTPNERIEFNKMKEAIKNLEQVTNPSFIELIKNRVFGSLTVGDLPAINLADLNDVSGTTGATTGQVLKKTATTWQPGTDIDT